MKVRNDKNGDRSSRSGEPGRKQDDDLFFSSLGDRENPPERREGDGSFFS